MAREVTIPTNMVIEDISGIENYEGVLIRFMVGKGSFDDAGVFTFKVPQQFETFEIKESLYQAFAAKYPLGFIKENLWEYVDMLRSGADATRPGKHHTWDSELKLWVEAVDYLELVRVDTLAEINSLAGEKILALYPQYKQANLTARFVELITLNETDSEEGVAIQAAWDWIKEVRSSSNSAYELAANSVSVVGLQTVSEDYLSALELI